MNSPTLPDQPVFPSGNYPQTTLTKRELFAAMALQGYLACPDWAVSLSDCARCSVLAADALIEAINKTH
jgi:hypothetical protein